MNSQNILIFKIAKSSVNKHLPIHWSCFDTFFMHKINLTHPEKEEKRMKWFFPFFENFDRDFGTLGIEKVKIWLQIRTRRHRIRLYANFGKFGCIISLRNNQLACFLSPCRYLAPGTCQGARWSTDGETWRLGTLQWFWLKLCIFWGATPYG